MAVIQVIQSIDPSGYTSSPLHGDGQIWPEKNCYVDLWIEVLHALDLETRAMLPFVVSGNFEDDQWTFFKPSHEDIFDLYGLEVQELTVWKPLLEHVVSHLSSGKLVSTEADAFWLPDVAGTDYRRNHSKTTIVVNAIDLERESIDYFHNASYFRLSGDDFRQLFRIDNATDSSVLPLFAEFIRVDRLNRRHADDLAMRSSELLRRYLKRRPSGNPVSRLAKHVNQNLSTLQGMGLDYYHLWAFGSIRQLGAGSELLAQNLTWLSDSNVIRPSAAPQYFSDVSAGCKTLILKGARAVATRRASDLGSHLESLASKWSEGIELLEHSLSVG